MRFFTLILAFGIAVAADAASIRAQDKGASAKDPSPSISAATMARWNEPAEPMKIVGPIHFVGTKGLGVWLITTPQGHILINTGMPPSGPMIETAIRQLGFRPEDIKLLLAGHAHVDHAGGHAYIKKISGARVAMLEAEKALLESGGKTDFLYGSTPAFLFEGVTVDRVLSDGETIRLGDVSLTAKHTPGHTRGSTTFIMDVVDAGRTYNVVFADGTGITPRYRVAGDESYRGIQNDFRRTFDFLQSRKPDIWLAAHTEMFDFDRKRARAAKEGVGAFVDPDGYQDIHRCAA